MVKKWVRNVTNTRRDKMSSLFPSSIEQQQQQYNNRRIVEHDRERQCIKSRVKNRESERKHLALDSSHPSLEFPSATRIIA